MIKIECTEFSDYAVKAPSQGMKPGDFVPIPASTPAFGDEFEGGFYAGLIWNQLVQSTTPNVIGTGLKSFTVCNMSVTPIVYPGQTLEVRSRANPANRMEGTVAFAIGTTLALDITSVGGSGTFDDWSIMSKYRVIVAPKEAGEDSRKALKHTNTALPVACQTVSEGWVSTNAMYTSDSSTVYPAAHWVRNLNINGYTDWYIPARDELELCWRNLKPTTKDNEDNTTGVRSKSSINYANHGSYDDVVSSAYGLNSNSSPEGVGYTRTMPGQTPVTEFNTGGTEAFEYGLAFYRTSSEFSTRGSWGQSWHSHNPGFQFNGSKTAEVLVRAVRRSMI